MNTLLPNLGAIRILLVEDETMLRETVMTYLNLDGFHCLSVGSMAGLRAFQVSGQTVDVLVLDLGLPDGNGIDAIESFIAESPDVPVVIMSAKGAVKERIEGLNRGADFYLTKPVDLTELSVVLKKLAKRAQKKLANVWSIDSQTWRLRAPNGKSTTLTLREKIALELVIKQPGTPVNRDVIVGAWGFDPVTYDFRRMESMLRRLRNKCQDEMGCALPLITVYGFGYVFEQSTSASKPPSARVAPAKDV